MSDAFKEYLKNLTHCVLSTVTLDNHSESAFVAFSENDALEIMIGTSKKSRKYHNILHNPNVSVVFGFDGQTSMQYEGIAHLPEMDELRHRLGRHYLKHPWAVKYEHDPEQTYVVIKPVWARISKTGPIILTEEKF